MISLKDYMRSNEISSQQFNILGKQEYFFEVVTVCLHNQEKKQHRQI